MAIVEEALYSRLTDFAGLTSLVGSRIYPLVRRQGSALPALSYQMISSPREHLMVADADVVGPRFQVDCWDDSALGVKNVAKQTRLALQDYSGTEATIVIQRIFLENEIDDYSPSTKIYRVTQDYIVWYEE